MQTWGLFYHHCGYFFLSNWRDEYMQAVCDIVCLYLKHRKNEETERMRQGKLICVMCRVGWCLRSERKKWINKYYSSCGFVIWKLWTCSLRIELNRVCWISIWSYPHLNKKLTSVDENIFSTFDYFHSILWWWMIVFDFITFFRLFGPKNNNSAHFFRLHWFLFSILTTYDARIRIQRRKFVHMCDFQK